MEGEAIEMLNASISGKGGDVSVKETCMVINSVTGDNGVSHGVLEKSNGNSDAGDCSGEMKNVAQIEIATNNDGIMAENCDLGSNFDLKDEHKVTINLDVMKRADNKFNDESRACSVEENVCNGEDNTYYGEDSSCPGEDNKCDAENTVCNVENDVCNVEDAFNGEEKIFGGEDLVGCHYVKNGVEDSGSLGCDDGMVKSDVVGYKRKTVKKIISPDRKRSEVVNSEFIDFCCRCGLKSVKNDVEGGDEGKNMIDSCVCLDSKTAGLRGNRDENGSAGLVHGGTEVVEDLEPKTRESSNGFDSILPDSDNKVLNGTQYSSIPVQNGRSSISNSTAVANGASAHHFIAQPKVCQTFMFGSDGRSSSLPTIKERDNMISTGYSSGIDASNDSSRDSSSSLPSKFVSNARREIDGAEKSIELIRNGRCVPLIVASREHKMGVTESFWSGHDGTEIKVSGSDPLKFHGEMCDGHGGLENLSSPRCLDLETGDSKVSVLSEMDCSTFVETEHLSDMDCGTFVETEHVKSCVRHTETPMEFDRLTNTHQPGELLLPSPGELKTDSSENVVQDRGQADGRDCNDGDFYLRVDGDGIEHFEQRSVVKESGLEDGHDCDGGDCYLRVNGDGIEDFDQRGDEGEDHCLSSGKPKICDSNNVVVDGSGLQDGCGCNDDDCSRREKGDGIEDFERSVHEAKGENGKKKNDDNDPDLRHVVGVRDSDTTDFKRFHRFKMRTQLAQNTNPTSAFSDENSAGTGYANVQCDCPGACNCSVWAAKLELDLEQVLPSVIVTDGSTSFIRHAKMAPGHDETDSGTASVGDVTISSARKSSRRVRKRFRSLPSISEDENEPAFTSCDLSNSGTKTASKAKYTLENSFGLLGKRSSKLHCVAEDSKYSNKGLTPIPEESGNWITTLSPAAGKTPSLETCLPPNPCPNTTLSLENIYDSVGSKSSSSYTAPLHRLRSVLALSASKIRDLFIPQVPVLKNESPAPPVRPNGSISIGLTSNYECHTPVTNCDSGVPKSNHINSSPLNQYVVPSPKLNNGANSDTPISHTRTVSVQGDLHVPEDCLSKPIKNILVTSKNPKSASRTEPISATLSNGQPISDCNSTKHPVAVEATSRQDSSNAHAIKGLNKKGSAYRPYPMSLLSSRLFIAECQANAAKKKATSTSNIQGQIPPPKVLKHKQAQNAGTRDSTHQRPSNPSVSTSRPYAPTPSIRISAPPGFRHHRARRLLPETDDSPLGSGSPEKLQSNGDGEDKQRNGRGDCDESKEIIDMGCDNITSKEPCAVGRENVINERGDANFSKQCDKLVAKEGETGVENINCDYGPEANAQNSVNGGTREQASNGNGIDDVGVAMEIVNERGEDASDETQAFSYIPESEIVPTGVSDPMIRHLFRVYWERKNPALPKNCRRRIRIIHCCGSPNYCAGRDHKRPVQKNCQFSQDVPRSENLRQVFEDALKEGRRRRALQSLYFDSNGNRWGSPESVLSQGSSANREQVSNGSGKAENNSINKVQCEVSDHDGDSSNNADAAESHSLKDSCCLDDGGAVGDNDIPLRRISGSGQGVKKSVRFKDDVDVIMIEARKENRCECTCTRRQRDVGEVGGKNRHSQRECGRGRGDPQREVKGEGEKRLDRNAERVKKREPGGIGSNKERVGDNRIYKKLEELERIMKIAEEYEDERQKRKGMRRDKRRH